MKTLRSISIAVLLSLAVASPAAASSTISLAVSSPNPTLGTPISYSVSGEAEVKETYEVRIMHVGLPEANCNKANTAESIQLHAPFEVQGSASSLISFVRNEPIPIADYAEVGTYAMCAKVRGASPAESLTSFTVEAPAAPLAPEPLVVTPPATPASAVVYAPVEAPLLTPVIAPTASQKLHAALVKCKKLKKHSKRVKCEHATKRAAGR